MKSSTMISLDIEGMHCSSCALLVEKSLKKVDGVESANVNFSSSQAMVKTTSNVWPVRVPTTSTIICWATAVLDGVKTNSMRG